MRACQKLMEGILVFVLLKKSVKQFWNDGITRIIQIGGREMSCNCPCSINSMTTKPRKNTFRRQVAYESLIGPHLKPPSIVQIQQRVTEAFHD